jgi:hypothetical protein
MSRSTSACNGRFCVLKCGKTGSARPTINCTAMTARMSPGTVEPTGVVASSPRHSMIMPNECRCKVDVINTDGVHTMRHGR